MKVYTIKELRLHHNGNAYWVPAKKINGELWCKCEFTKRETAESLLGMIQDYWKDIAEYTNPRRTPLEFRIFSRDVTEWVPDDENSI